MFDAFSKWHNTEASSSQWMYLGIRLDDVYGYTPSGWFSHVYQDHPTVPRIGHHQVSGSESQQADRRETPPPSEVEAPRERAPSSKTLRGLSTEPLFLTASGIRRKQSTSGSQRNASPIRGRGTAGKGTELEDAPGTQHGGPADTLLN